MPKKENILEAKDKTQEELLIDVEEAEFIRQMTDTEGYRILKRDADKYRKELSEAIPHLDKNSKEFDQAVKLYLASDLLITMIEQYDFNRKRAEELLLELASIDRG